MVDRAEVEGKWSWKRVGVGGDGWAGDGVTPEKHTLGSISKFSPT